MRIYSELDLSTFEAWSGAANTLDRIRREGKCGELESVLEENYPEGIDETELNDLLWFDSETVYEWVGLQTESEIESEIEEAKLELADLEDDLKALDEDYNTDCEDVSEMLITEVVNHIKLCPELKTESNNWDSFVDEEWESDWKEDIY